VEERQHDRPASADHTADAAAPERGARGADRRRTRRFVARDRRTGFDRRRSYPLTGALRENPRLLAAVLVAVNVLSALDFVLTQAEMDSGIASEGNPVLASLFEQGPGLAWLFKTVIVLGVSVVIWRQRHRRAILSVAIAALAIYALVIAYHLSGILAV
jgi:hypothetical protein